MKAFFPVFPKAVCGVASSLGVENPRHRGQPVFVLRDGGVDLGSVDVFGSECMGAWLRAFGGVLPRGYSLVARDELEYLGVDGDE
jgi:hypothetical protein